MRIRWDRRLSRPVDGRDHALGPEDAPITLVVYGDYLCPRTRRAWPLIEELLEELWDRLRVVWRHFPLPEHVEAQTRAQRTAEAAEAAEAQGLFWEMHGALFKASQVIEDEHLVYYAAAKAGLDRRRFERHVERRVHAGMVLKDLASGLASGVRETPAFFVDGASHDESYLLRVVLAGTWESAAERA
jgi:formate-nitrite transporter family protein